MCARSLFPSFPQGFQVESTLGLENAVARDPVADVLRHLHPQRLREVWDEANILVWKVLAYERERRVLGRC